MMFHQRASQPHELLHGVRVVLWCSQHFSHSPTEYRLQQREHCWGDYCAATTRLALNATGPHVKSHKV
jgi:hypothetical protein